MTQIGEGVGPGVLSGAGDEECIFCGEDHQDEEPEPPHNFPRDMGKLKKEGRSYTKSNARGAKYPDVGMPPLVEWSSDITETGGYKAAAHHCIALKTASEHKLSGEMHAAGYDPNRGSNCIWLPYSRQQFVRARAYLKPLQKHRGGHTDQYFLKVKAHLDQVLKLVEEAVCPDEEATKDMLLTFLSAQENALWSGVANPFAAAYHLYNDSYLEPMAPWGSFAPEEVNLNGKPLSRAEVLRIKPNDGSAEAESAEDPE